MRKIKDQTSKIKFAFCILILDVLTCSAAVNLVVPLEMLDYGGSSSSSAAQTFTRSRISMNDGDYDGATYYFEITASNTDSADKDVILTDGTTTFATIAVDDALGAAVTRLRSASFAPYSGNRTYYITIARTTSTANVKVYSARIVIVQVNATKTRIQIPLNGGDGTSGTTTPALDSTTSTDYCQNTGSRYSLFAKAAGAFAAISTWRFECTAKTSNVAYTTSCSLFNATNNTRVGSGVTTTSTGGVLLGVDLADNEPNFHDGDQFEVRIKTSDGAGTAYMSNAHLYCTCTSLSAFEVYWRIAKQCGATVGADTFEDCRVLMETGDYSASDFFMEGTGACEDNAERFHLQDDGTDDSGTAGSADEANSGINFNNGTKALVRTGTAMTLTDNNRYWGDKDVSTGNGTITNYCIVIDYPAAAGPTDAQKWWARRRQNG